MKQGFFVELGYSDKQKEGTGSEHPGKANKKNK